MVRAYLASLEPQVTIRSIEGAMRWGDSWRAHAQRLEVLLLIATAQRDASETLLRLAEEELARLRAITA